MKLTFYDAHTGYGGPMVPLPLKIKQFLDKYEGTQATWDNFQEEFRKITKSGTLKLRKNMVIWSIKTPSGKEHYWRLFFVK